MCQLITCKTVFRNGIPYANLMMTMSSADHVKLGYQFSPPPFYFGEIWPVVSNTQGALIHNTKQEVLNTFGEVIPRLYVAGEIGSIWGYLYLSGGNLSECIISGNIAGIEISNLKPHQDIRG